MSMILLLSPIMIVFPTGHNLRGVFIALNELLLLQWNCSFDGVRRETIYVFFDFKYPRGLLFVCECR